MKKIALLIFCVTICGCGSITTLSNSETQISNKLNKSKTYCSKLSRVYSGVAYDLCHLHSAANSVDIDGILYLYFIDIFASAVVDTVVLPYSIVAQINKGSIDIE